MIIQTTISKFCPFEYGKGLSAGKRLLGNIPVYGSNGIVGFHNEPYVTTHGIIIGRKGSVGALQISDRPFWPIDTSFYVVKDNYFETVYTFYLLKSLGLDSMNSDSAVPGLNRDNVHALKVNILGTSEERKATGQLIARFDDKIENNRRMNGTLEEMARAIFKSWFVDFDPVHAKAGGNAPAHMNTQTATLFPNSFGDNSLPLGWNWCKLGECISFTKGRSYKSAELQDSDTALVTLKSFLRGGGYRPDGLKPYIGTYKDEQTLKSSDLIVALTDVTQSADVIGKPAIVRSNDQFNTLVASLDVGIVRPIAASVSIPFLYCMMMTHDFQSHIYGHTSGTTVLHLSKEGLPNYQFGMPTEKLLDAFTSLAEPIFSKIELNEATSKTLAELRDTLLPKLMSGEIRVKDAEREVEGAV